MASSADLIQLHFFPLTNGSQLIRARNRLL
jgi:hypothetical protein